MPKIRLRNATEQDARFLWEVMALAVHNELPDASLPKSQKAIKSFFDVYPPETINVIQVDGVDAGRLRVVRHETHIYLGGIQLHPKARGQGIGTHIIQNLIDEAKQKNQYVLLEVKRNNPLAIALYKRMGFQTIEERDDDFVMKIY